MKLRNLAVIAPLLTLLLAAPLASADALCTYGALYVGSNPGASNDAHSAATAASAISSSASCSSDTGAGRCATYSATAGNIPVGATSGSCWASYTTSYASGAKAFWFAFTGTCESHGKVTHAGTTRCDEPAPPTGAPTDSDCAATQGQTGNSYKQYFAYDQPNKVLNCTPGGCGLNAPTYDLSGNVLAVATYTYTGQNCADHGKDTTQAIDPTAPTYVTNNTTNTTTTTIDNSTGAVTSTTTTRSSSNTVTSGGADQAIIDGLDAINDTLGGLSGGGSGGATAAEIGDALTDPENEDKPDPGTYGDDAEGIIGGTEDAMDAYYDTVGEGLGDATDGGGWSSTMGGLIPSYSCSDFNMEVHGIEIELKCSDTATLRAILAWFVYAGTVAALFYLVTEKPTA